MKTPITCLAALLAAACSGELSSVHDPDDPAADELAPAVFPRLTTQQYRNAVRDLLGTGLPEVALEADTYPYLFASIGAATTTVSEVGVQQYEEAAHTLTSAVFDDAARRQALVGCAPVTADDACVTAFLTRFTRRAFRRTLAADELETWLAVARSAGAADPWRGLRITVAGILQSPGFLYRVELGEPDPDDPSRLRYTGFEMASRLAFLFWDTLPDEELLGAAERGELIDAAGVRAAAERLMADPRAAAATQSFFAQYLDLGRLGRQSRDPALYLHWTDTMAASMRREIELLTAALVAEGADTRTLFSTRRTFVNDELAALYGVEAPGATHDVFVEVELPADGPRAGLLTLGGFLTMNAHPEETSPTLRGKYIRERVLCELVPPPPQEFDIGIGEEGEEPKTMRERMEAHAEDPACAGCHTVIDPPGFLFEGFDAAGASRTQDFGGNTVDTTGDLDGVALSGAADLAALLATDERVPRCLARQFFRHASGRLELPAEEPALDALVDSFAAEGYPFRALALELVTSGTFRHLAPMEASR